VIVATYRRVVTYRDSYLGIFFILLLPISSLFIVYLWLAANLFKIKFELCSTRITIGIRI